MNEKMDDRTTIYRNDGVHSVSVFLKILGTVSPVPGNVLKWHHEGDCERLTLGEIRDQVRQHIEWPIYVWMEGPTGGEIYCTGNHPGETCWRRCGITGGYA